MMILDRTRERRTTGLKRLGYPLMFLLVGSLMPLSIWVAAGSALVRQQREARRARRLACLIDADCPAGYACVNGHCIPIDDC
ncbi:MAG: hypothetical protein HY670_02600 [Chloroflexi bacterium]|nr:hypothetical protein [Chloroflexota bacterium]